MTEQNPHSKILCYYWDELAKAKPYLTVYGWEKHKFGDDHGQVHGISEEESTNTNLKLREILIDYFEMPTMLMQELLYGSEGKSYSAEKLLPILQQIIDRFNCVYAVLKADAEDSYFVHRVIIAIMRVMAAYTYP